MKYQAKLSESYMPASFLSQILKLLLTKSSMIQLGFGWALKRGLEARGKN